MASALSTPSTVRRLRPRWSRFIPSSAPERGPPHLGAGTLAVGEAEALEALAEGGELGEAPEVSTMHLASLRAMLAIPADTVMVDPMVIVCEIPVK